MDRARCLSSVTGQETVQALGLHAIHPYFVVPGFADI